MTNTKNRLMINKMLKKLTGKVVTIWTGDEKYNSKSDSFHDEVHVGKLMEVDDWWVRIKCSGDTHDYNRLINTAHIVYLEEGIHNVDEPEVFIRKVKQKNSEGEI